MSLTTLEESKQQYTLKVRDLCTGQEVLATFNGSAILTTDHDELIQYAARMAVHFGTQKIYTVCFVTPLHASVPVPTDVPTDREVDDGILKLSGSMKEIPIERKPFDFSNMDE